MLIYDLRPGGSSAEPPLLTIGSPMGAAGFGRLAGYVGDHTVVTYDPRGVERSRRTDGARESTPDEHADDLHRLIAALGVGPVHVFASSGDAVNALVLPAGLAEVGAGTRRCCGRGWRGGSPMPPRARNNHRHPFVWGRRRRHRPRRLGLARMPNVA